MTSSETIQIFLLCYLAAIVTQNAHDISGLIRYGSLYELLFQCIVVAIGLIFWTRAKKVENRHVSYSLSQHESLSHQNNTLEEAQDVKLCRNQTKIDTYLNGEKIATRTAEPHKSKDLETIEELRDCTSFGEVRDLGLNRHSLLDQILGARSDTFDPEPNIFTATAPKPDVLSSSTDAIGVLVSVGANTQAGMEEKKKKRKRRSKAKNVMTFIAPVITNTDEDSIKDSGTTDAVPTPGGFEDAVNQMKDRMQKR